MVLSSMHICDLIGLPTSAIRSPIVMGESFGIELQIQLFYNMIGVLV